jgi:hypothetical protein
LSASLGIALLFTFPLASSAQAQFWFSWHSHHRSSSSRRTDSAKRDRDLPAGATQSDGRGTIGPLVEQLIRDCNREVIELKNLPGEGIAQTISPDDKQAEALKNIRSLAAEAAGLLEQSCPKEIPASPPSWLDVLDRELEAAQHALDRLQPPLQTFYESLTPDQKSRLVARYVVANIDGARAAEIPTKRSHRRRRDDDQSAFSIPSPAPQRAWDCDLWQAELRAWPVERVDQVVQVAPRQRAAFYELAAALQHAADGLADTCPREPGMTPVARTEDLRKKLDAMRQSLAIIRPALGRFYASLDGGQKDRFATAM